MFSDILPASKVLEKYRSKPVSGFRPLTDERRTILEETDKPKKGGKKKATKEGTSEPTQTPKKRKAQVGSSAPDQTPKKTQKVKMAARNPRTPTPSESESSQGATHSDVRIQENEPEENEDTATTSQPEVSQPITTNPEVHFCIPESTPTYNDFCQTPP
ncbi:unnamed protein product [Lactuca virosa]|uniref:Uncharacterized protein n=1 Tax=Lactuca virosa TaxID=75947 RepID=A0AAU9NFA7_9ASTR|nr:unnamed protein product [Lactuca virosa]